MKALLLAGVVVVAAVAVAVALPRNEVAGLLDLDAETIAPPPEIELRSPAHGEGVGPTVFLTGEATATGSDVIDVQYRIDGERWTSVSDLVRGHPATAFRVPFALLPGDHVLEVRSWDGDAYSHAARALVRRDAPTIRIVSPVDGEGVSTGELLVEGTLVGAAEAVRVDVAGRSVEAVVAGNVWSAIVAIPNGTHTIVASALADVPSLPASVTVAAAERAPPSLSILTPHDGDAFGEMGDPACIGGCILFAGTSRAGATIAVELDGFPAGNAALTPTGAWSFRLPILHVATGTHVATFTPEGGVARNVTFVARTPHTIDVRGDLAPRPTFSQHALEAVGEGVENAEWFQAGVRVAQGRHAVLVFGAPGDHTVDVRVPLPGGRTATTSVPLHALNRAPSVALADPALVGVSMRLAASATDEDGRIVAYRWELGDGTRVTTTEPALTHRYLQRGLFPANVTVVDDHGGTARASTLVLVPNVLPVANFSWEPARPSVLDVVRFTDTSRDHDGTLTSRLWSFDGANASDNSTPAFRFASRGAHLVTLTVLDDLGEEGQVTKVVDVANLAPTARFSWEPVVPRTHDEVLFYDNSTDPDGPLRLRTWTFEDGTSATGPGTLRTFRAPGVYNVTLEIVDDLGATANITLPVRVVESQPAVTAVVHEPARPISKEEVRFRVLATDRDGDVVALHWDFGDSTNSTLDEPVHRYARKGTYAGSVTVYDAAGLSTIFPFLVEVDNALPTTTLGLTRGGYAALPSLLEANASDPDGRIAFYRFDPDGDGDADCETIEPTCEFHYLEARPYLARVWVEDDDGGIVEGQTIVDILAPPSHLAPPVVSIEAPTPYATLRGDHLIRGDARGVRPIAKVEMQLRNDTWAYSGSKDPWRLMNGGPAWSSLVDTRSFADGQYELVIRATDTGGGHGFARIPVSVLNGPRPSDVTLQLLDPPATIDDDTAIRGSAFHPQGVTSVRWRIDDDSWRYVSSSPLAFTLPLDADTLETGPHMLQVEAYRGPHEKATLDHAFSVVGAAPTLIVDTPPAPIAYGLLHATGRIHGDGHAQWRIDHDVWRPLGGPTWNLTHETIGIRGGQHTLELRGISPDGKHASAARSWTLQIVNPPFDARDDAPRPPAATPPVLEVPMPTTALFLAALAGAAVAARRRA